MMEPLSWQWVSALKEERSRVFIAALVFALVAPGTGLFVELIRDRVATKIDQYYDEQIFYLVEQREGSFGQVRTNLIGPKVDTSLNFRLENQSGEWLVYDVVIDDASIVRNYRTQFSRIIRDSGLAEKMKQRVHTVKWFEKTASAVALLPTDMSDSR